MKLHAVPLLLACLGASAQAAVPAIVERAFSARVSVDAAGRVTGTELLGEVPEGLRGVVAQAAAALPFEPATRSGLPVPSRTSLQMQIRFVTEGRSVRAEVLSAEAGGPSVANTTSPRFPGSVLAERRNMRAVARVRLRTDGGVDLPASDLESFTFYGDDGEEVAPDARQTRDMRRALLEAMAGWTFVLEEVDGQALAGELRVPVTLCRTKRDGRREDGARRCAEWSRALQDRIERPAPLDPAIRLAQPALPKAGGEA